MSTYQIKQSSTAYPLVFLMIDSADHVSAKTGLSPTVTISKAGAAFGSPAGAVTEIANGWYKVAGNATDTATLGSLILHASAGGADPTDIIYEVVAHDVQDAVHLGLSSLPNTACTTNASLLTSGTGTDQLSVTTGRIDIGKALGTAVTLDANNVLNVSSKYWAGTAITATSIPVATAAGASGGLVISGSNAGTTTFGALTITGATTLTGNVSMAAGLNITQSSSNTSALVVTGNGTGSGAVFTSGSGATGDAMQLTAASTNGNGFVLAGVGTGAGLKATGGATGRGAYFIGGATSGAGLRAEGTAGNSNGFEGQGQGSQDGMQVTGGATGRGFHCVGGATSGAGFRAEGTAGNSNATEYVGQGSAAGLSSTGGATGHGVSYVGGATSGDGMRATATTSGKGINAIGIGTTMPGILATGGSTTSAGLSLIGGATSGDGLLIVASASGHGISSTGAGTTKHGINAAGGSTTSHGILATGGGVGHGIQATSGIGGDGIRATSAATNGNGLNLVGAGTGAGLLSTGGATGQGFLIVGGGTSGDGIKVTTTSGHGMNLAPVGSSMHGLFVTGGNAGTSDGIKAVAGTGGVPIRGDITGNITGTVATVTTVTNQLTAAQIATGVWQDTTSGDFTTASSIGKSLYTSGAVPGATGGLFIAGTNAATTVTSSFTTTFTGNLTGSVASVATGGITAASIADGAIDNATFAADTGLATIRSGTAQAGAATTITLDASASAVNSFYINDIILITGGTGVGQARFITAYVGATKVATVSTWATNPDNTSTFAILPFDAIPGASAPTAAQVATAVWQDATSGDFTVSGSIGKSLFTSGAVPGATGGLFIAGTNAATTVTTAFTTTFTGSLTGSVASVTAPVTISAGTGSGQLDFTSGVVKANTTQWLGGTIPAVNVTGVPLVDTKYFLGTLSLGAAGYVGVDWGQVTNKTTTNALTGTTVASTQKVDIETIKTNPVVNGGTITFPTTATLASTTNITAGTVTTVSGNVNGSVASLTTNNDKTGYSLTQSFPSNFSSLSIDSNGRVKIQSGVTKNVALSAFEFKMVDSGDHVTAKTGLTITSQRSIDGGAFASSTNSATEVSNGIYKIDLSAADLNGNVITFHMSGTGADANDFTIVTTP